MMIFNRVFSLKTEELGNSFNKFDTDQKSPENGVLIVISTQWWY